MKTIALQDCLENGKYVYNIKLTPVENYQFFLQSIAFSRGIEFLSSTNVAGKYILYLYDLPGLTINLKMVKQELNNFYENLLKHIDNTIKEDNDAFIKYACVYDLFREVQDDLNFPAPVSFLAIERIYHNPDTLAKIKEKNIKLIKGTRKGAFDNYAKAGFVTLTFDQLSNNLQEFIQSVFGLKNRFKQKLFQQLKQRITILFNRRHFRHFQYTGKQADIAEVAILLFDQISTYGKSRITLQEFSDALASFLSIKSFRLNNLKDVLLKRKANQRLFIMEKRKMLSDYITDSI